jgi:colicin import membrane protein
MKVAYTISGVGHAAVLLWSVLSLSARSLPAPPPEALPIDIVSLSEFTQMTAGAKDAAKTDTPKPFAETVDAAKPTDDVTAKVDTREVQAAREPPPAPEAKPVEAKPEQAKVEPKPKPDPIAETLAKEQAKKPETKKADAKPPIPRKKPQPPTPKFDADKVADLLNKQQAKRVASAGPELNPEPSLGQSAATAAQLSLSELDAFRRRLGQCWTPPPGVDRTTNLQVIIRVQLKSDGSVAKPPDIVSGPASALGPPMAESARRAILSCQPFKMLSPEHYDQWKDIEITFDPREMFRG